MRICRIDRGLLILFCFPARTLEGGREEGGEEERRRGGEEERRRGEEGGREGRKENRGEAIGEKGLTIRCLKTSCSTIGMAQAMMEK